jgi:hypothetical protein
MTISSLRCREETLVQDRNLLSIAIALSVRCAQERHSAKFSTPDLVGAIFQLSAPHLGVGLGVQQDLLHSSAACWTRAKKRKFDRGFNEWRQQRLLGYQTNFHWAAVIRSHVLGVELGENTVTATDANFDRDASRELTGQLLEYLLQRHGNDMANDHRKAGM